MTTPVNLIIQPGFTGHIDTPGGSTADPEDAAHAWAAAYVDRVHPWDGEGPEPTDRAAAYDAACAAYTDGRERGATITIRPLHELALTAQPAPEEPPVMAPTPTGLLHRYERLNPNVRELRDEMWQQSFTFYLPESRGDGEASTEYLRAVYRGKLRRLALYVNSSSLTAVNADAKDFAKDLPGTEMLASGAVFRYNRPDGAVEAAEWTKALTRWADGRV